MHIHIKHVDDDDDAWDVYDQLTLYKVFESIKTK